MSYWLGTVPNTDDFGCAIIDRFYDVKTKLGPWAILSPASYKVYGIKLGTGYGQCYEKRGTRWVKVEG